MCVRQERGLPWWRRGMRVLFPSVARRLRGLWNCRMAFPGGGRRTAGVGQSAKPEVPDRGLGRGWGRVCLALLVPAGLAVAGEEGAASSIPEPGPRGLVWEADLCDGGCYDAAVRHLLRAYEARTGASLRPGERGKVGLKVNTRSGPGLSTPLPLLRAVVEALETRGFAEGDILIVGRSAHGLREAGILPPLSAKESTFGGCPVLALDSGNHYDDGWFYDSPLPPALDRGSPLMADRREERSLEEGARGRKSFLPMALLFEVDYWFNLAAGVDDPALGVDGALANATLWNVSNSRRFLVNQATASAAVAEIAAIPELRERMLLHFVSLERYQFIGGPRFNSLYSRSEPILWMSSDPVALDRLVFDRINAMRRLEGFPEISPLPDQFRFAKSLGLGVYRNSEIRVRETGD